MSQVFGSNGNTIRVRSGKYIDLVDPKEDQFDFSDIAGGLSKICRFSGQSSFFYSVAEHSCHCAFQAIQDGYSQDICAAVFGHDFAEFSLTDCPSPLKALLPEYKILELRMEDVISKKFGLEFRKYHDIIKSIDHSMLIAEKKKMMSPDGVEWNGEKTVREITPDINGWNPDEAEVIFTSYARFLCVIDNNLMPVER